MERADRAGDFRRNPCWNEPADHTDSGDGEEELSCLKELLEILSFDDEAYDGDVEILEADDSFSRSISLSLRRPDPSATGESDEGSGGKKRS